MKTHPLIIFAFGTIVGLWASLWFNLTGSAIFGVEGSVTSFILSYILMLPFLYFAAEWKAGNRSKERLQQRRREMAAAFVIAVRHDHLTFYHNGLQYSTKEYAADLDVNHDEEMDYLSPK